VPSGRKPLLDFMALFAHIGEDTSVLACSKNEAIFSQGDNADAVFYILEGTIKLTVVSELGKEAILTMLEPGTFFGESCLTGHTGRRATAWAREPCRVLRIPKATMLHALTTEPAFAESFITHLLSRAARVEGELIDQLFNSCEKRLARLLLVLADFGKKGRQPQATIPKISQQSLAEMVGTTRSRISFFMNRFRKQGFIEYNGTLRVHSSLLTVVLQD
jgi:CRP/FNR family cyclic AMP-dependent transcriptional regulator